MNFTHTVRLRDIVWGSTAGEGWNSGDSIKAETADVDRTDCFFSLYFSSCWGLERGDQSNIEKG